MKRSSVLLLAFGLLPLLSVGAFVLLAAAGIAAGGAIIGGMMGQRGAGAMAGASKEAGQLEYDASMAALDLQREMYETGREDMAPWLSAGAGALGEMEQMRAGEYDITTDPSYQFRLQEGLQSMQNMLSAKGMRDSGASLKAGQQYGQEYASQEWGNVYNRLASLAGVGQTSAGQLGQAGLGYAGGMANTMMAGGAAQAGGVMGAGQARQSAYMGMGQNVMDLTGDIGNMMTQQYYMKNYPHLFGGTTAPSGPWLPGIGE